MRIKVPSTRFLPWLPVLLSLCLTFPIEVQAQLPTNECGSKVAFTRYDGRANIFLLDLNTRHISQLTQATEETFLSAENPSWSPTGGRIVFSGQVNSAMDTAAANEDLFIIDADGTNLDRLTDTEENERSPKWSPTENQVAFLSDKEGNWDIYIIDLNDMAITNLTNHEGNDGVDGFTWSPDGTQIAFTSDRNQGQSNQGHLLLEQIFVVDVNSASNGEEALLDLTASFDDYDNFYRDLAWSPDGEWLAFSSYAGDIFLLDIERLSYQKLLQSGTYNSYFGLSWSPDSAQIVFVSHPEGSSETGRYDTELFTLDVREAMQGHTTPTQITAFDSPEAAVSSPVWQPCLLDSDNSSD